ncbi:MAG: hypothetical protein M1831_002402 [Alyxoria varia]|nr:MAG: hypothetical protein M1831_002402 [Alyxoria varia]
MTSFYSNGVEWFLVAPECPLLGCGDVTYGVNKTFAKANDSYPQDRSLDFPWIGKKNHRNSLVRRVDIEDLDYSIASELPSFRELLELLQSQSFRQLMGIQEEEAPWRELQQPPEEFTQRWMQHQGLTHTYSDLNPTNRPQINLPPSGLSYYRAIPGKRSTGPDPYLFALLREKDAHGFGMLPEQVLKAFMRVYFPTININYVLSPAVFYGMFWIWVLRWKAIREASLEARERRTNEAVSQDLLRMKMNEAMDEMWPKVLKEKPILRDTILNDESANAWDGDPRIALLRDVLIIAGTLTFETSIGRASSALFHTDVEEIPRELTDAFDWSQMTLGEARSVIRAMEELQDKYNNIIMKMIRVDFPWTNDLEQSQTRDEIKQAVAGSFRGYKVGLDAARMAIRDPEIQRMFREPEESHTFLWPDQPRERPREPSEQTGRLRLGGPSSLGRPPLARIPSRIYDSDDEGEMERPRKACRRPGQGTSKNPD